MEVRKSIQKMSRLPNSKSICEKYGLSLEDPVRVRKRAKKILKKIRTNKYRGKSFVLKPYSKNKRHNQRYPKTHYLLGRAKCSTFWVFWPESDDVNLDKITIFCCLNCIFEFINGFNVLKNP
jgi:hypothetical protein